MWLFSVEEFSVSVSLHVTFLLYLMRYMYYVQVHHIQRPHHAPGLYPTGLSLSTCMFKDYFTNFLDSWADEIHDGMNLELYYQ